MRLNSLVIMLVAGTVSGGAEAGSLSLQLEGGVALMAGPADDTYVDYHLPGATNRMDFDTAAFGAAIRADSRHAFVAAGWRNLGTVHMSTTPIEDVDYIPCRPHPSTCKKPGNELWNSGGNTQQVYLETGYKIHLGSFDLIPSGGIADNRIAYHTANTYSWVKGVQCHDSITQHLLEPFFGLSLAHGPVSIGAYMLSTAPNHNVTQDPWYPGQGSRTGYFRVTYALGVH